MNILIQVVNELKTGVSEERQKELARLLLFLDSEGTWTQSATVLSSKFREITCPVCSQIFPVIQEGYIPNHYYPNGERERIVCYGSEEAFQLMQPIR